MAPWWGYSSRIVTRTRNLESRKNCLYLFRNRSVSMYPNSWIVTLSAASTDEQFFFWVSFRITISHLQDVLGFPLSARYWLKPKYSQSSSQVQADFSCFARLKYAWTHESQFYTVDEILDLHRISPWRCFLGSIQQLFLDRRSLSLKDDMMRTPI